MTVSMVNKTSKHIFSSLFELIKDNDNNTSEIFHPLINTTGFAFIIHDAIIILSDSQSDVIMATDGDIYLQYEYFITNFINKNKIDFYTAKLIIDDFLHYNNDEKKLFKLFSLLSWPGSKKGLDIYHEFSNFSTVLISLIKSKKIGINESFYFHNTFKNNYDELLTLLTRNSTYSESNIRIRLTFEISGNNNQNALWFYQKLLDIKPGLDITNYLYSLKHERLIRSRLEITKYIKELQLPDYATIVYDANFEKTNHTMNITFSNIDDLKSKISSLNTHLSSKKNEPDFLNVETLFNSIMDSDCEK
ncbi:MAG: hypothetical protein A2015_07475 [Spirochaetes bacterium GWF1_31_7]|nr:MAG: hypothetical protein A2Y30_02855 [Spirochaetes bacterium GWE1_32_154]OHD47597.1 MAG: hypothetical protein A2Y29_00300 [Spirochaetes bacterium GWE2_31_10]OHD51257.1 MAG: hypothetical protein A2015_07475 [Spirochaetes bacterium GWF1_31_7]OHD81613.1 MAG: hypothetical protein A2355_11040 [Spirochaetes bacterium RIFOXYB1_FULL_32_8]HBD96154.1 hypothetical protein [Spirochaetia bacterium]